MGTCEVCGTSKKNMILVTMNNETHEFATFECAIHKLAPVCAHCDCKIIGHPIEENGITYCCSHCLQAARKNVYIEGISEQRM